MRRMLAALVLCAPLLSPGLARADDAPAAAAPAAGDAAAGKVVFTKCAACHAPVEGVNKVGPSLWGVVGRPSASIATFNYSEAMKGADKVWTPDVLNVYLENPRGVVVGTKMLFVGLKSPEDRANVIAYLETLKN